jgi:hypothetical protein
MQGRLGMLIDGTGDDYKKIQTKKNLIEKLGYDAFMIFVNTSLEVALERNAARSRSLPEDLAKLLRKPLQNRIGKQWVKANS